MRLPVFRTSLLVLLVWGGSLAEHPVAQRQPDTSPQPPVTFKVEVDYVEVDAVVTDGQGNFIRNLSSTDFQVLEDGTPQAVTVFSLVDLPIERAERPLFSGRLIEPDVRSNDRAFDGRVYVLVLDDLHTSVLRSTRVRAAARRFIERRLGTNDLAAVVHTSGRSEAAQEFTSSPRLLLAAIDKFAGRKLPSSVMSGIAQDDRRRTLERGATALDLGRERLGDSLDPERGYRARSTLRLLEGIAEALSGIRGRRKAVVLISEGLDYDIYDVFNLQYASTVLNQARDTIGAATRANVSIYAIDPRGLTSVADENIELGSLPSDLSDGTDTFRRELLLSHDSLRVLADETGGFTSLDSNDSAEAFDRIVRDNSSYYMLGYYPSNTARDGKFRTIEVRVNQPGLQVRARKGYVAPRGNVSEASLIGAEEETSRELREALTSPVSLGDFTLRAFAAPFKGTAPNASVAVVVEMEGRDLAFSERDERFLNTIETSVIAIDAEGTIRDGERQSVDMTLRRQTYEAVVQTGVRMVLRVDLRPGRYQLRIAAREVVGGSIGSVSYDLEVPDFSKPPLSMSGLVVASQSAVLTPTAKPDPQLSQVLPAPPTATRTFPVGDGLALFTEVYDNEVSTPHQVGITTTVRSDEGRVLFQSEEVRSTDELQGARGGYGHVAEIPLRDLPPGLYVLRVDARSRLDDGDATFREILFRIRDPRGEGGNAVR